MTQNIMFYSLFQFNNSSSKSTNTFTEKELAINVQKCVEGKLLNTAASPFVHPLCLCLDTIANALQSLTSNLYVSKQYNVNGAEYTPNRIKINELYEYLLKCCEPFRKFHFSTNNDLILNKLWIL